jgi:hypothetical protein
MSPSGACPPMSLLEHVPHVLCWSMSPHVPIWSMSPHVPAGACPPMSPSGAVSQGTHLSVTSVGVARNPESLSRSPSSLSSNSRALSHAHLSVAHLLSTLLSLSLSLSLSLPLRAACLTRVGVSGAPATPSPPPSTATHVARASRGPHPVDVICPAGARAAAQPASGADGPTENGRETPGARPGAEKERVKNGPAAGIRRPGKATVPSGAGRTVTPPRDVTKRVGSYLRERERGREGGVEGGGERERERERE